MSTEFKAQNLEHMTAVLLPDGWHKVDDGTFDVLFVKLPFDEEVTLDEQAQRWFSFQEYGAILQGPFSSIVALRWGG